MADIAAKVRRLARAGLETPALWYEAVNAYRPIWEAGRASNRVVSKHEQQIAKLLGEIRFAKIPGFFPTPDTVANRMAEMAQIATRGEVSVLEPGGGTGSLVEAVYRRNKNARVVIYERQHTLAELLRLKFPEATVHFEDFTEAAPSPTFDVVIMNPPYEKRQDAEQVVRAWRWVKPGGILVALISEGPFTATDKKSLALREWLESVDGRNIPLKNAFKGRDVFRQTGVATRIIVARKDR
jgi:phospholipid N-methyltransferase